MAATSEARALPFFTDLYGQPLESGFIYIGQAGLDPFAYPAIVTSDLAGEVVVAQPIRTTHGHAAAAGALIHLFVPIPYSITILDSSGRLVYASLNETDPVSISVGTSAVQSASSLAELRARDKNSTNQVWVDGYGMYIYVPTDSTSPESIPGVIVGADGARYHLGLFYVNGSWVKASSAASPTSQGAWLSWNDSGTGGETFITNNPGSKVGGVVLRVMDSSGTVELGRATLGNSGDFVAGRNMRAPGGTIYLGSSDTRYLNFNGTSYQLPGADLAINGGTAITSSTFTAALQAALVSNQQANGVGALALGTSGSPSPVLPGTWVQTGTASNSVYLWVRTA